MMTNYYQIKNIALKARKLIISATTAAGSGHPGGSLSMTDILGCLFTIMKYDPTQPSWNERDRLILSKGHASPGLFSYLALFNYFSISELDTLRKFGSRLQGHPDLKCPGIEFCGGSLGIGLSFSIGCALAAKIDNKKYHIYTIMGDGETNEGQIWEAAMTAAKYNVDNLTVILDRNYIQQDSHTEKIMPLDNKNKYTINDKWKSFGWNVIDINGHQIEQILHAITQANATKNIPSIIIAHTIKGKGIEHMERNPKWHGQAAKPEFIPLINMELDSQYMISPSVIAGDLTNLPNEIKKCESGLADCIHLDVMDGIFVNNKTFDYDKIKNLRAFTLLPFDVHLMIHNPAKYIKKYIDAGSDTITVHVEACNESSFGEIHDVLKNNNIGIGLAINPNTNLPSWSYKFIKTLNQLIVMSVFPGKSGQQYIESTHNKIQKLVPFLHTYGFAGYIEVDGGVCEKNISQCFADGARIFVGGNAILRNSNVAKAISTFRYHISQIKRKLILQKANELGGKNLITKWINLHNDEKALQLENIVKDLED